LQPMQHSIACEHEHQNREQPREHRTRRLA
jgi:hypothetical protein